MNVAVEWKDVLIESLKGAVILTLLERFYVTRAGSWFEDHIGAFARQAILRCACDIRPGARCSCATRAQTTTASKANCSITPR